MHPIDRLLQIGPYLSDNAGDFPHVIICGVTMTTT